MRILGKQMVKENMKFKKESIPEWLAGFALWSFAEHLTLLNILFPFDKNIKNKIIKKELEEFIAKQRISLPNKQDTLRRRWKINP